MSTWVATVDRNEVRLVDVDAESKPIKVAEATAEDTVAIIERLLGGAPLAIDVGGHGLLLFQLLRKRGVPVTRFNMAEARAEPRPQRGGQGGDGRTDHGYARTGGYGSAAGPGVGRGGGTGVVPGVGRGSAGDITVEQ